MSQDKASYSEIKRYLSVGYYLLTAFFLVACAYSIISLFYPISKTPSCDREFHPLTDRTSPPPIDNFHLGALGINRSETEIPLPDIQSRLVLLSLNDRFDATRENMRFEIGIRGSSERRIVRPNERIYLGFKEIGCDKLHFDDIPSPIWIRLNMKGKRVFLEVGLDVVDEMGEKVVQNRTSTHISPQEYPSSSPRDPELRKLAQVLSGAHIMAPDQLYEVYGYGANRDKRGKYRFLWEPQNSKDAMFIPQGSLLFLHGDGISLDKQEGPVAKLEQIDGQIAHIKIWDRGGLEKTSIQVKVERPMPVDFNVNEVFRRLRKRSGTTVSCLLGNKNALLKQGDWVLHTKMGWKVIKNKRDLKAVIDQRLPGELFVFDGIEKVSGKSQLVGHLFDKSRSQVLPINIPFSEPKSRRAHSPTGGGYHVDEYGENGPTEYDIEEQMEFEYFDFDF